MLGKPNSEQNTWNGQKKNTCQPQTLQFTRVGEVFADLRFLSECASRALN